jgi:hypothetical protein
MLGPAAVDLAAALHAQNPSPTGLFLCGCSLGPFGTHFGFGSEDSRLTDARQKSSSNFGLGDRGEPSKPAGKRAATL